MLKVEVGKKEFSTPTYFPAVSRKEIRDSKNMFVELVTSSGYPRLLISSYDYGRLGTSDQRRIIGRISDYYRKGSIILLDSGMFESYWRGDLKWTFGRYQDSVRNVDSDFYFSYDALPSQEDFDMPRFLSETRKNISASFALTTRSECIPIVHARSPRDLVKLARLLVKADPGRIRNIGVSERELGRSISERGKTVAALRKVLGGRNGGLLHLLGCGNPLSMAVYAYAGADTFDSLDWALSACDRSDDRLVDYSHLELLNCKCDVCKKPSIDSFSRIFLHNLLFYQDFSIKLQSMIKQQTLTDYLQQTAGKELLSRLGLN